MGAAIAPWTCVHDCVCSPVRLGVRVCVCVWQAAVAASDSYCMAVKGNNTCDADNR